MPFDNDQSASELCLLSGLARKQPGTKVRFLGCVESYDESTAVVTLGQPMGGTPTSVKALVSLVAVFDRIRDAHVAMGVCMNIIGRISTRTDTPDNAVGVDAIRLWPSGALDYRAYENEVAELIRLA